jgi:adenylate cyclase
MVGIVFKYGGTLDKFLGDGLMALFGVPFELPDAETRATLCALEMLASVRTFNERYKLAERGLPPLHIGVGIASGPVVAGNIGSEERMEYTVIGDTVNFAARLESLNRSLGTTIIVSEATQQALGGAAAGAQAAAAEGQGQEGHAAALRGAGGPDLRGGPGPDERGRAVGTLGDHRGGDGLIAGALPGGRASAALSRERFPR